MNGDIAGLYGQSIPTDQADAATGFDPLPPGWYSVEVSDAEVKDTNAGNGKYLQLNLTVVGDHYANRKVFARITLVNPNEKAVQIGMRELAGLGQACELTAISDTSELIGKLVDARLKIEKGKNGYEDSNRVTAYAVVGSKSQGSAPAASSRPAPAAAPVSAGAKRPWER